MGTLTSLAVRATTMSAVVLAGCLPLSLRNQAPREGASAPITKGIDAAGRPLDLGEYRGQVVLLSFWHGT